MAVEAVTQELPPIAELGEDLLDTSAAWRTVAIASPFVCTGCFFLLASLGWWWLALPSLGHVAVGRIGTGDSADPASDVVRRRVVEDALATLRPQARAALVLRHYYGYDYAQIGTFLGTSSGTVGSTLSRAHALLRERLRGSGDLPLPAVNSTPTHERRAEPPEVLP